MVNLTIPYAGPDGALTALAAKLRRIYGNPARTYEFVTGYKSAANESGHNADNTGRAHAMDIFVGPGNLTEAQGIDLAERLRAEGKRGKIPGHPDRLAYIIHRGQIAGDHTNWEWIPYTGKDWHGDHIHVSSVFDYYWGDPIPGNPADYNSTADWNLWEAEFQPGTATGQGSGGITPINPTPIQEDELTMADINKILGFIATVHQRVIDDGDALRKAIADAKAGIKADLATVHTTIIRDVGAQLAGIREAVSQTQSGKDIDWVAVEAAAKRGAEAAIAEGVVKVDVSIAGGDK